MKAKRTFEVIGYIIAVAAVALLMSETGRNRIFNLFKSKPYLELTGSSPYDLTISDFPWGYGVVMINQFNGDFDKLDEKVYDLLKGKTGICRVNIKGTTKDKYGNADGSLEYIGDINIDELNKYQDWKYWQREAGIRTLLYKHIQSPKLDSVPITPTPRTDITVNPTPIANQNSNEQPVNYMFSIDDLYALSGQPSIDPSNRWVINGTIGEFNFAQGWMQVITSDGNIVIQFYVDDAKPATVERLRSALEIGNAIRCIVTKADSLNYQLLAAKVTPQGVAKKM